MSIDYIGSPNYTWGPSLSSVSTRKPDNKQVPPTTLVHSTLHNSPKIPFSPRPSAVSHLLAGSSPVPNIKVDLKEPRCSPLNSAPQTRKAPASQCHAQKTSFAPSPITNKPSLPTLAPPHQALASQQLSVTHSSEDSERIDTTHSLDQLLSTLAPLVKSWLGSGEDLLKGPLIKKKVYDLLIDRVEKGLLPAWLVGVKRYVRPQCFGRRRAD